MLSNDSMYVNYSNFINSRIRATFGVRKKLDSITDSFYPTKKTNRTRYTEQMNYVNRDTIRVPRNLF